MSTNETFSIIGLTGGIASGKTTVSQMIAEHDRRVIDADQIAREIVEPGEPALEEIRETFGDEVIDPQGALDRDALGEIIFDDASARSRLDAITHPRIAERMMEKANRARDEGEPWVVYDAALIVENGLENAFDALVVVAADRAVQIERLRARDGLDEREAAQRVDAQMPLSKKLEVADWVIDNNGTLDETRRQVETLVDIIDRGVESFGTASRQRLVESGIADATMLAASNFNDAEDAQRDE